MKKLSFLVVLATMLVAFAIPNHAQAQQQDVGQATFGNLIAALNNINAQIRALENVNIEDVEVRVVNVEDVKNNLNNNQIEVLNNALQNADIDAFQNFLNNNEIIKNVLNQNNVDVDDVVAVNVLSGGDITVFVQ